MERSSEGLRCHISQPIESNATTLQPSPAQRPPSVQNYWAFASPSLVGHAQELFFPSLYDARVLVERLQHVIVHAKKKKTLRRVRSRPRTTSRPWWSARGWWAAMAHVPFCFDHTLKMRKSKITCILVQQLHACLRVVVFACRSKDERKMIL